MGMLLTDTRAAKLRKNDGMRGGYLPEPDPHDLCGLESGGDTSPFFCDESARPSGPIGSALRTVIPADIVIGG